MAGASIDKAAAPISRRIRTDGAAAEGTDWSRASHRTSDDITRAVTKMLQALRSALLVVVVGFSSAATAEDIEDRAALTAALEHVKGTLEDGLQAGERIGKPISAK